MRVIQLRIDGQEFYLAEDVDVDALQQQIIAAVTGPPAFVSFRPIGRGDIAVLVTANIPVRFEVQEHSEAQVREWAEDPPSIDLQASFPTF